MKWNKAGMIVGAVLLMGAGGFWFKKSHGASAQEKGPAVAEVERRNLEVVAEAAGLIEPVRVVEVKSKASGEVLRVLVESGQKVDQGTLLAEIDPRDVQSALEQAQADVDSARVKWSTSDASRKRLETLRGSNVVTQQELETAVETAAAARANVVRTETALRLARERRGDVTLHAPVSGTVLERTVESGQIIASATANVSGGTTLFKMADLSEMQVRAKVDETDVGQIQPGMPVKVTVEAYPGRTFRGTIAKIEPQAVVEQNVTLFPVLVRLPNPEGLLKSGMNAEVSMEIARRQNVAAVPNSAVTGMREARSAAALLGVDEEMLRKALRPSGGPGAPGTAKSDGGASPAAGKVQEASASANPADPCAELREKMLNAGGWANLGDDDREKLKACRAEHGGGRGADATGRGERKTGVLFVMGASGPEPRLVTLGLSDWEYTEVIDGVQVGDKVVQLSVAQIQKKQQEMNDRFRQGSGGGMMPGAGGTRGGGRGR